MSYLTYLTELLRPLGVYDMDQGTYQLAELAGFGLGLDGGAQEMDRIQREMLLSTAEDSGLEAVEALLPYRPVTNTQERRRAALAALLRIGGDGATLAALNDNLAGCGVNARVTETGEAGTVEISFPEVPGVPEGFPELKKIIEEIIPCHLAVRYFYWYINWTGVEQHFAYWSDLDKRGLSWAALETLME